ncbi:MAG: hypothetical protein ABIR00_03025, partial [Nitrosospira sp.]
SNGNCAVPWLAAMSYMYACANGILPINFGNLFCLRALKRFYESGFLAETSAKVIAPCMSMTASSKTFDQCSVWPRTSNSYEVHIF